MLMAGDNFRDLKPSNILVARDKDSLVFKLGDLDTIKPNPSLFTKAGFYTPEILPPDCYLHGIMSDKVDICSLGGLLFKLFTGEHPFRHRNKFCYEKVMDFASNEAFCNCTPHDIPAPYGSLMAICLTVDPDDRTSAVALLEMLEFGKEKI